MIFNNKPTILVITVKHWIKIRTIFLSFLYFHAIKHAQEQFYSVGNKTAVDRLHIIKLAVSLALILIHIDVELLYFLSFIYFVLRLFIF